jgi:hypothetical protein
VIPLAGLLIPFCSKLFQLVPHLIGTCQ